MSGPTGVGNEEITRRLAGLTGAPFVKVEASKYTEVGYYGRDVESIVRDLVESAVNMVQKQKRSEVQEEARQLAEERLLDLLFTTPEPEPFPTGSESSDSDHERAERQSRTREKFREMLNDGLLEDRMVELHIEQRQVPVQIMSNMGSDQMEMDLQSMFERIAPRQSRTREMKVADARDVLFEQAIEELVDREAVQDEALRLAESSGVIFIDEIDKVCGQDEGSRGPDVSRQGVQRDLLPIVEGTSIHFILFIAAGAFHKARPSDMMPELQGRFPIRVELTDLTRDDFVRILTEPSSSLTRQYQELLGVDGVNLEFAVDGIETLADMAFQVNQSTQNIGARRLHTLLEKLLEGISFDAPDLKEPTVRIDAEYVQSKLQELTGADDLSDFIL